MIQFVNLISVYTYYTNDCFGLFWILSWTVLDCFGNILSLPCVYIVLDCFGLFWAILDTVFGLFWEDEH